MAESQCHKEAYAAVTGDKLEIWSSSIIKKEFNPKFNLCAFWIPWLHTKTLKLGTALPLTVWTLTFSAVLV